MKPRVFWCERGMVISATEDSREGIMTMIDIFGENADWIVVMMTGWTRRGVNEEYLGDYEQGQIESDPQREEVLFVQVALRDGSKKAVVKRIIREEEGVRFEEAPMSNEAQFEGYLSLWGVIV